MKKQALAIIAHPDDETIWMGGAIFRNKDWNWTIFSLCRGDDKDRMQKFLKTCKLYNAKGKISNLDDNHLRPLSLSMIISKIKENLKNFSYDFIFTHGNNGEYGHVRHLDVHKAVKKMIEKGELKCEKVFYFDYEKGKNVSYPELVPPKPKEGSLFKLELTEEELNLKKRIVKEIYGYPNEKGFELLSCNKMETFKVK